LLVIVDILAALVTVGLVFFLVQIAWERTPLRAGAVMALVAIVAAGALFRSLRATAVAAAVVFALGAAISPFVKRLAPKAGRLPEITQTPDQRAWTDLAEEQRVSTDYPDRDRYLEGERHKSDPGKKD
jgi:hypothetical protein